MTEAGRPRTKLGSRGVIAAVAGAVALIIAVIVIASSGSDETPGTTSASSTATSAPSTTAGAIIVTIAGKVTEVQDSSKFVVNDGKTDFSIVTSAATKFVDLQGGVISANNVEVDGTVQVTGAIVGSTITAGTVLFPNGAGPAPATAPPAPTSETSQP